MAISDDPRPDQEQRFEDGLTLKTVLGAIFIALFMLPGGLYLGLVAGQGVGDAAEWVTIVLFAEVARRSYKPLKKQEIYVLFYIAASLTTVVNADRGLAGGPFASKIWDAYFRTSDATRPFASQIPQWAVPAANSPGIVDRSLWHHDWWIPIVLLVVTELLGRLSWMGLGYALFRITSDVEKLPFPMAPVAASGATALSEAGTESWRWGMFSTGTVVGLMFGFLYIAVPVVTGVMFGSAFEIFPIPFADYTSRVATVLPAAVVGLSFNLANVLTGFVLPFEIVAGAAAASVLAMVVANPILVHLGMLPHYASGGDALATKLAADMDFWLSIGIGVNLSVAIIGIGLVVRAAMGARQHKRESRYTLAPPVKGRGDIPIAVALGAWLFATVGYIGLCRWLVPNFPVWILMFFGLLWSPLNSYVSARMIGLTGRGVSFPYLKEGSIVASGYQRVDVWYAPIPLADHGAAAQRFREVELTGTKFTSIFKAEALMFLVLLPMSYLFWAFFWSGNPLPSAQFPFAQRFWPFQAQQAAVLMQINAPRGAGAPASWFAAAIKPLHIAAGAVGGVACYGLFSLFKLPLLFFYGFAGGLGLYPANTIPQLFGAWFGRRHMAKRYGEENWRRYAPVLLAGFACGTGLISMVSISMALVAKAVAKLPY